MTKKIVTVCESEFRAWNWEGSLSEFKTRVEESIVKYGPDATISFSDYDGATDIQIYVKREETDAEYKNRLEIEKVHADSRERVERAQYEALRKKYG